MEGYLDAMTSNPSRDSTLSDVKEVGSNRRGRALRRMTIALLTLAVLAGALGAFGERSSTVTAEQNGYRLQVTYGATSRAGLDTPWLVTVTHPAGFTGPVTLATTADYFDIFESQGFAPEPSGETSGGRYLYQQFVPPPGDQLRVSFDAYVQPSAQRGRRATTVLIVDGHEMARVSYRTRLWA